MTALPASDALTRRLIDGLQTLGLADATPAQVSALRAYLDLLAQWNRVYNLTALRDTDAMLTQHLLDCLAVIPPLRRHAQGRPPLHVLDVGSGGGLPAVVIATMQPEWRITAVDTVGKKAAFIQQAAAELHLPALRGCHGRIETLTGPAADLITARAFSSLAELVRLSRERLAAGGCWMAMKGQTPTDEIAALPGDVEVFHVEPLSVPGLDAQRCLVWMRLR